MELQGIRTNGSDGAARSSPDRVTAGNGDGVAEKDGLLSEQTNGEKVPSGYTVEAQSNVGNKYTQETSNVCRIKRELNEPVFWRIRLWMVIIFIFLLIFAVILISLAVCSAVIHEDVDEKFDPSLFKVPRYFNGSFQLPNLVFTEELSTFSSNESQALADELQEKLSDLYRSSPALGRYFSHTEIYAFRNGSVIAEYQLKFIMPEEQQDQLRNVTLSREMVYNVFRQFLYDQEPEESGQTFIDPDSLDMVVRH